MLLPRTNHTKILLFTLLAGCYANSIAMPPTPSPVLQTQSKLKQLDAQIKNLKQNLVTAHDKRGTASHELSHTEKQIGEGVRKLRLIQHDIQAKQQKIAELQAKDAKLNNQLVAQQQLLASHVRARYQMGEYQPLKWLLNQDDSHKISRLGTYYQYMIQSRQQLIASIDKTRHSLQENKENLNSELAQNTALRNQLAQHQQQLEQTKKYHTKLIQSLNEDIEDKQQALEDFQKNKANLTRLLESLSQQSVVQNSKSITQMRRKLPFPVQTEQRSLQRMNQGVTFFADEGTAVTAVYPGKVVFSDWLKGYGLLLIVDHGQGFMTLYAHNQSLFKRKGQYVRQNEQIASVGHSGGIRQNGLYFEVRVGGKAVSPHEWLA